MSTADTGPNDEQIVQDTLKAIQNGLMCEVSKQTRSKAKRKVTVVGAGQVGMACALSLLTQQVVNELALVDVLGDKVKGEMMDLQHGSLFLGSPKIEASTEFTVSAGSQICVVTAGARQLLEENRLDFVERNVEIFRRIIPLLVKHSPDTILLIVSNPVDILTQVAWRMSGLPRNRVFGSGTNLDSARLRFLVSQQLNISPSSCHGWVIGEHGDSSVAVWSGVNVAGVRIPKYLQGVDHLTSWDEEQEREPEPHYMELIHWKVINSAHEVIRMKGETTWAIGLSVSDLCQAVLTNAHTVHAVSVSVQGVHNIRQDVFLSLPCVLGEEGVTHIVKQPLKHEELRQLRDSAQTVDGIMQDVKI